MATWYSPPPRRVRNSAIGLAFLSILLVHTLGCRTWRPPPVDLAEPAWSVRYGQAVWHPAGRDVELAGDLCLATTADGRGYVQFSKGPLVLAEARVEPGHWLARFPDPSRTFSGSGEAPARLLWNQVLGVALGRSALEPWTWTGSLSENWRLAHRGSGEWLEGPPLR